MQITDNSMLCTTKTYPVCYSASSVDNGQKATREKPELFAEHLSEVQIQNS
jgi:hypothetical protein